VRFGPYPEWIEAELVYDIAGELGGDQDAVLRALSKNVRELHGAVSVALEKNGRHEAEESDGHQAVTTVPGGR
jgi:hypothetical protein